MGIYDNNSNSNSSLIIKKVFNYKVYIFIDCDMHYLVNLMYNQMIVKALDKILIIQNGTQNSCKIL